MEINDHSYFWKSLQIITSCLALVVVYANARFGIRNKQADLTIHFHKQFDELQKERTELLTAQKETADHVEGRWSCQRIEIEGELFFDRFWSLQFDQFLAWYEGYIPTRLYVYWVFSRWRELHKASSGWTIGGKTMAATLEELNIRWQKNPDISSGQSIHINKFLGLMYSLKQRPASADFDDLLGNYGPPRWRRYIRCLFGAY